MGEEERDGQAHAPSTRRIGLCDRRSLQTNENRLVFGYSPKNQQPCPGYPAITPRLKIDATLPQPCVSLSR